MYQNNLIITADDFGLCNSVNDAIIDSFDNNNITNTSILANMPNIQKNAELLKKIKVNTLITTGENDAGSTPEMSKNLSKMIQGSKFVEIKRGKHLCGIECAVDVNITFKKFIDQHND